MSTILQENIITKLGLGRLSVNKQADLVLRMAKIIQERIALRVMKLLPEAALDEYLKLADNDEIGANKFLSQKLPDYASIIEDEIVKFKQEITA